MKIECGVEKIREAVFQAERITGKNLTLPVLGSLLFVASGKSLKIRATNLNLGIEIEVPAKISKEGIAAVNGSVMSGILSNIPSSENLEIDGDAGNITIKTKRNKIKIKGQPADDFPTIPPVAGASFDISSEKICDGIKSVYYSSSVSDIKPEISSVYMYSNEGQLVFVSTDSFRLAEKKIKLKSVPEIPGILIPFKNAAEILRVLGETDEEARVSFNKNQISFTLSSVYLTSRLIDGVFPDYRQIIPKEYESSAVVLKQDLLNALKLSNIFSDKFNQINLEMDPKEKKFELSSANSDVGENRTALDAALSGERVELSFNYKYFLDCFQSISSDSLSIKMKGSSKPILVSGVSDPSFLYLIMPMNR